jgi:predicted transcriptional regulator
MTFIEAVAVSQWQIDETKKALREVERGEFATAQQARRRERAVRG